MANISQQDIQDIRALAQADRAFAQTVKKERELTKKINDAESGLSNLDADTVEALIEERKEMRREIRTKLQESRA
ncbi:hypothetical protein YH65_10200 [Sulfurovum lithotrophicum]|uniref:DUF465 domain-containing protein n=1 Tax=Sulfurovum lithotrophicum TaxID=206403 RepID=A0A7U4M2Y8_9BACT|nr:hypothetical protein [Sulfurovum lithotrophicum]AKF25714.1 hypothetical protein YH65_10200 [Sulfurovum lithotrophicum]